MLLLFVYNKRLYNEIIISDKGKMSNETERIVWYDVSKRYCSRFAQTATDFADASHSKSAKSVTTTVSYGIFSSENAYPCTVTKNDKIWLTIQNAFDNIYQVNSISHGGVVSTNVWFVNILIIGRYIIWQILNNETHVYRWTVNAWTHCWQLIYMGLCYVIGNFVL